MRIEENEKQCDSDREKRRNETLNRKTTKLEKKQKR